MNFWRCCLALAASLDFLSEQHDDPKVKILGDTLDAAATKYLLENKAPSRKVNQIDNRGSHFYLALYWAQALAAQTDDADLAAAFAPVAETLTAAEAQIAQELLVDQRGKVGLGDVPGLVFGDAPAPHVVVDRLPVRRAQVPERDTRRLVAAGRGFEDQTPARGLKRFSHPDRSPPYSP